MNTQKYPPPQSLGSFFLSKGLQFSGVHGSGDDALGVDGVGVVCGDVGGGESFVSKTRWEERRGGAWSRRQLNCGPTMTGVSISSLFILQQEFLNTFR